ncbi:hypothetical protein OUZ56_006098 [Daphnia magna]|uniref:Uncharacterized protein n=1 Tax=Daphnia magna TaxID=35525 RepID=A0ABQ9YUU7_9CRUS|nr:hypothetical protein OUZ56_006098 [Daphnia magna]
MTQPVFFTLKMLTHLGSLSNMTRVQVDPVLPYRCLTLTNIEQGNCQHTSNETIPCKFHIPPWSILLLVTCTMFYDIGKRPTRKELTLFELS